MTRLVLASGSPRRLALLRQVGFDPVVHPADVDEAIPAGLDLADAARHLAEHKAEVVARRLAVPGVDVVLGADTIVEVDGRALGKPADPAEARTMLRRLSGRTHHVHTGVCVITAGGERSQATATTAVTMRRLADDEIQAYVATGEGDDAAGAYAIQGRAGLFVTSIEGEYYNVVGLPLALVGDLLRQLGTPVHHRWTAG